MLRKTMVACSQSHQSACSRRTWPWRAGALAAVVGAEAAAAAVVSEVASPARGAEDSAAVASAGKISAEARSRAALSAAVSRARLRSALREFKAARFAGNRFATTGIRHHGFRHGRRFFVGGFVGPGYYDDYYDYPYYVADDSYYDDGGCYVVRRRVHTRHGWRFQPVSSLRMMPLS